MNAKVRMQVGRVWVEVDAGSVKDAIRGISDYAEFFSHTTCGMCGDQNARPSHREAKGYDFYEMECLSCGAVLSFGQTKEGGRLFPKRKNADGYEIGKDGWHQYQGTQTDGGPF